MLGRGNGGTRVRGNAAGAKRWIVPAFLRSTVPSFLRQVAGMPNYAAHLEHLRRFHPGSPVPTEREFYEEFIRRRYEDGPTRCC